MGKFCRNVVGVSAVIAGMSAILMKFKALQCAGKRELKAQMIEKEFENKETTKTSSLFLPV